jgi:hypothetical protein
MEDNLNILANGRQHKDFEDGKRPRYFVKWKKLGTAQSQLSPSLVWYFGLRCQGNKCPLLTAFIYFSPMHYFSFGRTKGGFSKVLSITSDGLGEVFEADFADMCAKNVLWCRWGADPGRGTPAATAEISTSSFFLAPTPKIPEGVVIGFQNFCMGS